MEVIIVTCPVCLETLNDDVFYCSDGYLYDRKCFDGIDFFKSPITREKITYWLPLERIDDNIVRFEKESRNKISIIKYDSRGFDQYGFDIEGFDEN